MEEMRSDIPQSLLGTEFPATVRKVTKTADCEHIGKMLHKGQSEGFVFYSDEPERTGGESSHPQPLTYIVAATGF